MEGQSEAHPGQGVDPWPLERFRGCASTLLAPSVPISLSERLDQEPAFRSGEACTITLADEEGQVSFTLSSGRQKNDLMWKTALHNGNNRGRNCHLRVTGAPATILLMMSETEKQFPLIRAASMNRQGAKSKYLTVSQ